MRIALLIIYFALNAFLCPDVSVVLYVLPTFLLILLFTYFDKSEYVTYFNVILFCYYIFFVIAPLQSLAFGYFNDDHPVSGIYFASWQILTASIVVFLFLLTFGSANYFLMRRAASKPPREFILKVQTNFILLAIGLMMFALYIPVSGGIQNLLLGRQDKVGESDDNLATLLLSVQVICTLICCCGAVSRTGAKVSGRICAAILLLSLVATQNPYNTARFFLISSWGSVGLILISGRIRTATFYVLSFTAIIFLMPILNVTTRSLLNDSGDLTFDKLTSNALALPFIDVFDTLCMLMSQMETKSFFWGEKTISLFLFFIPRAIWEGKATLTGLDVGLSLLAIRAAGTENLSMFVGGDFYADAGILGAALGGAVVAGLLYWIFVRNAFLLHGHNLKTYMLIAAIPILVRGPVGATVGLLVFELVALTILIRLLPSYVTPSIAERLDVAPTPAAAARPPQRWGRTAATLVVLPALFLLGGRPAHAGPVVFWASDPVGPGEIALVTGADFGSDPKVQVRRLDDGIAASTTTPLKPTRLAGASETSLKIEIPPDLPAGVFELVIETGGGEVATLVNAPTVYWVNGDLGRSASPGGWIRVFGRNIVRGAARLLLVDAMTGRPPIELSASEGGLWDGRFALPTTVPPGNYQIQFWSGQGDRSTVRRAEIVVEAPPSFPGASLDVRKFGAAGNGITDDSGAFARALQALGEAGGGTLLIPRGTYLLSQGIKIPAFSRLRGEDPDLSVLLLKDQANPPDVLIEGTHDFAIEDITILASNHWHLISAGIAPAEPARNVRIDHVTIRASFYRKHLDPETVLQRYKKSLSVPGGAPDAIRLRGSGLKVTNSDISSSNRSIDLVDSEFVEISGNTLRNGRRGWYSLSRSSQIVFENNSILGGDLESNGGGINTLFGTSRQVTQNVLFKGNRLADFNGLDGEAMTTDGFGGCYWGPVTFRKGSDVATLGPERPNLHEAVSGCAAGGFVVVDGRGVGAYALIRSIDGRTLQLDRPMPLDSDTQSIATLIPIHTHFLAVDNQGIDTGVLLQAWGGNVDQVFADNRSLRSGGYSVWSGEYVGFPQANFYAQLINNQAKAGFVSALTQYNGATSLIRVFNGAPASFEFPLIRGVIIRDNSLDGNATIQIASQSPKVQSSRIVDVIIERNTVRNADEGIDVGVGSEGVLIRNNVFDHVNHPLIDRSRQVAP